MGEPTPSELSAQQKLAALQNTGNNQTLVSTIAWTGHGVSAGYVLRGAITTYRAARTAALAQGVEDATAGLAGRSAVRCFLGRLAVPVAGAMAGAFVAQVLHADDGLLWIATKFGAQRQATPGPEPACVGHEIAHTHAFAGLLAGLAAAAVLGAVVGLAIAASAATGGLAAPLLIGGLVSSGGLGLFAGGFVGGVVAASIGGAGAKMASITGKIITGSPDVFFENQPVARVSDQVQCDDHSHNPVIIEGSKTIFINDLPLARIGHRIKCNAVIQQGCKTLVADRTTQTFGEPDSEFFPWQQAILSTVEVLGFRSATRNRGLLDALLRKLFGEPIDAATGDYADYRTDFEYPSVLPLKLTRCYAGKHTVEGVLGDKWICNWSQRLTYSEDDHTVLLEDADGQRLVFEAPRGPYESVHLKAPYYRLTGTSRESRLFDSRTQQTLVFVASPADPYIGRLSAIEDRNGNRIDFAYFRNRLQRVVHSDGVSFEVGTTAEGYVSWLAMAGDDRALVNYSYNENGGLTAATSRFKGQFFYEYNERGWLTHWRDSGVTRVYFDYDEKGRVVGTRTPDGLYNDRFIYHPTLRQTQYIDATGARRVLWFNDDNLLIREQDPLGNITLHTWDSLEHRQSTTDALGRVTQFKYDPLGRLIEQTDWAGRTIHYQYDKDGLPVEIQFPNGLKSAFAYDSHGNLLNAMRPDGATTMYTYDNRGRLLSETDPAGATRKWEYTEQGRLCASVEAGGQRTKIEQDVWGRPVRIKDAAGYSTQYEYLAGPENPRASLNRIVHPDGGEEHFGYDQEGLLAQHTGAEGQARRFAHGAFDLLRSVTDPAGYSLTLEYDGAARLTQLTNAMGDHWIYTYDPAGRLAMETDWAGRRTRYGRDAAGRLQSKLLPDGVEQHFLWDNRDRIVGVATDRARIEYEYDDADRLTRAATYYLSAEESEAPSPPTTEVRFSYNEHGQLEQEIQNGMPISYRYDAAGRCVSVISPSGETRMSFDPRGLLMELDSNGHALEFRRDILGLETKREYKSKSPGAQTAFTLHQSYDPCGRLSQQHAGHSGRRPGEYCSTKSFVWTRRQSTFWKAEARRCTKQPGRATRSSCRLFWQPARIHRFAIQKAEQRLPWREPGITRTLSNCCKPMAGKVEKRYECLFPRLAALGWQVLNYSLVGNGNRAGCGSPIFVASFCMILTPT